jgi:hypothetical protein
MTILVLLVAAGEVRAVPETITYEIITDQSLLSVRTRYVREFIFWGQFQLLVDYDLGTATFENVNVTIEEEIRYIHYSYQVPLPGEPWFPDPRTDDLSELFLMTELESTSVTSTGIDFLLEHDNSPRFPMLSINLELMFDEDLVHITGHFGEIVWDGSSYYLDATATVVPEPATILFLSMGGLLLISRKAKRGKRRSF